MMRVVPIVAAEVRVAVGRLHFENAVADFQHGNVERAAAQVIDGDLLVLLLVEAVGERRRGRFVDDAQHFEAGDFARVLGRVALRVVEISRHGDDRLRDLFAELRFRVGLELRENHRGNFRRRKCLRLAVHFHLHVRVAIGGLHDLVGNAFLFLVHLIELAAHEALDGKNVFCGLVTAWRLAAWPTSRSPFFVKATTEGVVRAPSVFSKTTGSPPSITAMQELVVPKSMPKTLAIIEKSFLIPSSPTNGARRGETAC